MGLIRPILFHRLIPKMFNNNNENNNVNYNKNNNKNKNKKRRFAHLTCGPSKICKPGQAIAANSYNLRSLSGLSCAAARELCYSDDDVFVFESQSGMRTVESGDLQQNVRFEDTPQNQMLKIPSAIDEVHRATDATDVPLGEYLARPVKIATHSWELGLPMNLTLDPWSLFLTNKHVMNRITSYYLIRFNLHIKIVINGNPFLYGRAIASYLPLSEWDSMSLKTSTTEYYPFFTQASQRPKIFLDPCKSEGGEMVLPFFYHKNYVNIIDGDYDKLGKLMINDLNGLETVNGAAGSCNINVFAWAEDVTLTIPTSTRAANYVSQSGNEIDEANAKGVISGPATTVASVAGAMTTVPVIGKYALATSKVASGIAGMAKAFGYSRPPVTTEPALIAPRATGNMATTTVPANVNKLTVDDKQELSIDPTISGLGDNEDPLSILKIAQKESFVTTFTWSESNASGSLLFNTRVTPLLASKGTAKPFSFSPTAVCVAALPFRYWTGCLKFRFQVVKSAYHRGRLRVVYDPYVLQASIEDNVNYSEVVDISEKDDFTVTIRNCQEVSILDQWGPFNILMNDASSFYNTARISTFLTGTNGVLGLYVLNDLTTPSATGLTDVQINMYVSAGDDFQVFTPRDTISKLQYVTQSGVEPGETQGTGVEDKSNQPEQNVGTELGPCDMNARSLPMVYQGEVIPSFRTLLKRYTFHTILTRLTFTVNTCFVNFGTRNMFPYYRGYFPVDGVDTITGPPGQYNLCNTVLFHYITSCFSGFRGGMRWKFVPYGAYDAYDMVVTRSEDTVYSETTLDFDAMTNTLPNWRNIFSNDLSGNPSGYNNSGQEGSCYAVDSVNPTVDVEIPFYSQWRFVPGKHKDFHTAAGEWADGFNYQIRAKPKQTASRIGTGAYCAVADDFQTYFWTGSPMIHAAETVTV